MVDERGTQACPDRTGMTGEVECRYFGRDFTAGEMALLRALIAASPPTNRHALSREFCRRIGWLEPDGGLKDMMARVTMLAMHSDGLITPPPPKWPRPARRPISPIRGAGSRVGQVRARSRESKRNRGAHPPWIAHARLALALDRFLVDARDPDLQHQGGAARADSVSRTGQA